MRHKKPKKFDERRLYNDRIYWGWEDLKTKLIIGAGVIGLVCLWKLIELIAGQL